MIPLDVFMADASFHPYFLSDDDLEVYLGKREKRTKAVSWVDIIEGFGGKHPEPTQDWEWFELPYRGMQPEKPDFEMSEELLWQLGWAERRQEWREQMGWLIEEQHRNFYWRR